MYITINESDKGEPIELFATIGKSGGSIMAKTEAIGRLITLLLQSKVHVSEITEQLKGITGEQPLAVGTGMSLSIPDSIGKLLERLYLIKKEGKGDKKEGSHSQYDRVSSLLCIDEDVTGVV